MQTLIDKTTLQTALSEPTTWPNLSQAAGITGLSKGMLSKQAQAGKITSEIRGFGRGERILPPQEVLRVGSCYRRTSQSSLVEALAVFLSGKLHIDASPVRKVLWDILETACQVQMQAHRDNLSGRSLESWANNRGPTTDAPRWLSEVEYLRKNPQSLAGTLSFTSANDLIGTIELGPSIDEPTGADLAAWKAAW